LIKLRIWDWFVCALAGLIFFAHSASEAADAFAELSHRLGGSASPEEHQKDDCNDKPMTDRHATPISVDPAQQRPLGSFSPSSLQ